MTTEQYSIGYDAGYQDGFDAALAEPVKQEPVAYVDSTPHLHVGDSSFEVWYQAHQKACGGDKQLARDAYAAGMSDPLVTPVERQWVDLTCEEVTALIREGAADGGWQGFAIRLQTAFKEKNK